MILHFRLGSDAGYVHDGNSVLI